MKQFIISIFFISALTGLAPAALLKVSAQDSGTVTSIVECGRIDQKECGFNDLIKLIENAIKFTITSIILPLVTLVILYYGVMLVISGDKAAQKEKAKKALWSVLKGLFFMLTAWLIVATVIKTFGVKLQKPTQDKALSPTGGAVQLLDI